MPIDPNNNSFVKTPTTSFHCYSFSDSPDSGTYFGNSDEDALEYDCWPGQIELISASIASSIVEKDNSETYTEYSSVYKVKEQVEALAETQAITYVKYYKMKQDNSSLTAIIQKLEERIHGLEIKSEEQIANEQKRNNELMVRLEREKAFKDYMMKLQIIENENSQLMEDNSNLQTQVDRLKVEVRKKEELLVQASHTSLLTKYTELEESFKKGQLSFCDKNFENLKLIKDLCNDALKDSLMDGDKDILGELASQFSEMKSEIRSLREENASLSETNEELQAQMLNWGIEERNVLMNKPSDASLVAQFEAMNESEILNTLKEQQKVITSLRRYIDGILMNIMEKCPKLLEVRK